MLLTDTEFAPTIKAALEQVRRRPLVIDAVDRQFRGAGERLGELTYEEFLTEGDEGFEPLYPADEWQAIGLNYTSGTTGQPKGVVVHHRGAYLAALGQTLANDMRPAPDLSLDPADVPLQRLDVHLGGDAAGRHARLPAPGRGRPDLRRDRRAQGEPSVRRADRHEPDRQRAGRRCAGRSSTGCRR